MADYAVTAASVLPSATGANWDTGYAGATITRGQWLYLDSTTNTLKLADANDTAATAVVKGMALNDAVTGGAVVYQRSGPLTLTTTPALTPGHPVYLSATPGMMAPQADLTTGWRVVSLGRATAATGLTVDIDNTGITL